MAFLTNVETNPQQQHSNPSLQEMLVRDTDLKLMIKTTDIQTELGKKDNRIKTLEDDARKKDEHIKKLRACCETCRVVRKLPMEFSTRNSPRTARARIRRP